MNTPLLLALLAACAATLYGFMAIWASLGRGHWFVRVAVVAAAIAIFIPVPAYDLAIVFITQSLAIVVPLFLLAAAQSAARRRASVEVADNQPQISRHRFSLIDLFLVTLIAAGIAGLAAHLPEKHRPFWPSYALIGAGVGAVSLAAAWATLGQRRSWLRWLVLLTVAASVSFGMRLVQAPEQISEALFLESSLPAAAAPPAWFAPAIVCSTGMAIALLLFAIHRVWPFSTCRSESTQLRADQLSRLKTKRIAIIVLLIIVSLLPASAYVGMLCPEPIPP